MFTKYKMLGYCGSKAAVNMMTVQLAYELRETGIKINAVHPGFTPTDATGHRGTQTLEEGAAEAVRLAILADGGPTSGFTETGANIPGKQFPLQEVENRHDGQINFRKKPCSPEP
jgi:NAD(P)-dependent dehydrogenase (short-subunit alcohol dehydrogenase family)